MLIFIPTRGSRVLRLNPRIEPLYPEDRAVPERQAQAEPAHGDASAAATPPISRLIHGWGIRIRSPPPAGWPPPRPRRRAARGPPAPARGGSSHSSPAGPAKPAARRGRVNVAEPIADRRPRRTTPPRSSGPARPPPAGAPGAARGRPGGRPPAAGAGGRRSRSRRRTGRRRTAGPGRCRGPGGSRAGRRACGEGLGARVEADDAADLGPARPAGRRVRPVPQPTSSASRPRRPRSAADEPARREPPHPRRPPVRGLDLGEPVEVGGIVDRQRGVMVMPSRPPASRQVAA